MKTNNVKKIPLKVSAILVSVFSVLSFVGGGLYACFGEGSFSAECSKALTVTGVDVIEKRGKNIANDRIELKNDIHITDASFCVGEDMAFSGVFDGCGHTVYLDYAAGDSDTSFFSAIAENGIVKNTRFVFADVSVTGQSFSGVAKINYGTVQDCAVEYVLRIDANEGMFTPFIAVNCGVVKSIVVTGSVLYKSDSVEDGAEATAVNDGESEPNINTNDKVDLIDDGEENYNGGSGGEWVEPDNPEEPSEEPDSPKEPSDAPSPLPEGTTSIHSQIKNDNEKKIAFAGTCIYNYGELKNVISTPRFIGFYCTSRDNYLAGRSENVAIASVSSFLTGGEYGGKVPVESGLVSICEKTLYTADDVRLDKYESFGELIFDTSGALNKTLIENTYDFNNNVWEIDERALCLKLKVK